MFKEYKVIDVHANLGTDISNLRTGLTPVEQSAEALLDKMKQTGIEKAIVLPFPSPGGQFNEDTFWYEQENQLVVTACKVNPDKLIPFIAVNPKQSRSVENIKTLSLMHPIKGIKLSHQQPMKFSLDQLLGNPLMDVILEHDFIFMIHIGTGRETNADKYVSTLDYAVKVAEEYPEIKFVFAHLGRLHYSLLDAITLKNVWFDTSGLSMWHAWREFIAKEPLKIFEVSTPIDVIEKLVELGWEDRLLFGSDEPYVQYSEEIDYILKAGISEESKKKIFYENAKKVLDI